MKSLLFATISLFLIQCTTTPKSKEPLTDVGLWIGKVQMTNKTTNNRKWANVVWASNSVDDEMRIDVTAAIVDIPLATFIKNGEGFHLWLFTEKQYFTSEDGKKLFSHLTKLSVHPSIFYSMLGQPKAPGKQWKCKVGSDRMECISKVNKTQLFVNGSNQNKREIKLNRGSKALRLRLSRAKVQVKKKMFQSLPTSQFKTIKL